MIPRMPPVTLLTFLVALATGFLSLAWVSRRSHHHYSPVTESLISPLVHFNVWVLTWLVLQYAETALLGTLTPALGRLLMAGLVWVSMLTAILWGSSYLTFTLQTTNAGYPQALIRRTELGAYALVGITTFATVALLLLRLDPSIRTLSRGLSSLLFMAVTIFSLRLFFRPAPQEDTAASRNLRLLGAAYSLLFLVLTLSVWSRRIAPMFQRYTYITFNVGLEILYNLVTVFWIHWFDRTIPALSSAHPEALPVRSVGSDSLEGFGISKRELEVINLICQGMTNQEIADVLFISLKTVKDHNYRIFQKTGVRNRVELVQLAGGTGSASHAVALQPVPCGD